ncbi:F-box domain [Macleaya cordata]|uniref:F-box domain n=1 Tax=Macleaya cordata TaxID=56857 RepID=A0A200PMR9_MACCD|nr:F-box domain [Macleaya cordata]
MELIPGLPEEIGLECLTRLDYTAHRVSARVCRRWKDLLEGREFYFHRKQAGETHQVACLVQSLPVPTNSEGIKPAGPPSYGVAMFDSASGTWELIDPVPKYPDGLPLFSQLSSVEGKLIVMGGWDPASWNPITDLFIYDFTTRRWKQGKDMPSKRSFFASAALDGKIFVAGGHDENKNALKSAWAYDLRKDEWDELTQMSEERDECEGIVIGNEFWVVSGYSTDHQGRFEGSAESYQLGTGEWKRVEDAWTVGKCPRACVGVGKDGNLVNWSELDSAVRVGACAVELGNQTTLVTGVTYQGAPQGFFLVQGQNGKLERIDVPDEFSGFVQSGCSVEI